MKVHGTPVLHCIIIFLSVYLFIYLFIYLYMVFMFFFIYFLYDKLANNYSSTHTFFFHVNLSLYFKLFPVVGFKMIVFMTMMMMTMMIIYHLMIIATLSF